jgi:predicted nucleic acid-binding protein
VHGLVLVTTNPSHFGGFKGLIVENWSKPRPRA